MKTRHCCTVLIFALVSTAVHAQSHDAATKTVDDGKASTEARVVPPATTETLGGSGTVNQLAKWTPDTSTLGASGVTELSGGQVGIGNTTPTSKLDVSGTMRVSGQTVPTSGAGAEVDYVASGNTGTIRTYNRGTFSYGLLSLNDAVTVTGGGSGKLGIGMPSGGAPTFRTEIFHSSSSTNLGDEQVQIPLGFINTDPTAGNYSVMSFATQGGGSTRALFGAEYVSSAETDFVFGSRTGSNPVVERMRITSAGVGIGMQPAVGNTLDVNGTIHASGSITSSGIAAVYQDVAEWVPSSEQLDPGTVVVVDPALRNHVTASSTAYDTTVAGVVSERPGISLGKAAPGNAQVATTGRVKVKVDASHMPIHIGDLLVTSDIAGMAMKSEPMEINGRRFHQPGTIIGKALEPLSAGAGEILVLLSLQ